MAGFHHPGDPYFPNQGNNGWLEESEEEPEEDPEEESEEEPEEESEGELEAEAEGGPAEPVVDQEEEEVEGGLEEEPRDNKDGDSDAESEVINPLIRLGCPLIGWATLFLHPLGIDHWRWSRQQGQRPPFGMSHEFYDLGEGGPADHAPPVMVRRLRNTGDLAQSTTDQMHQMRTRVDRAEQETREVI
ncbi:uncharacterized protein LOC128132863 [Lactuca sativa]|uniref:uncharacterized protein LOC128132863 n=1 Tax=Lactuca sativa TaxID=4236 RepID=UPI0022AF1E08|nr:uncharacterized protein LOC128132863 [Lactuca sativa]